MTSYPAIELVFRQCVRRQGRWAKQLVALCTLSFPLVRPVSAQVGYDLLSVLKSDDRVGTFLVQGASRFSISGLNNRGNALFWASTQRPEDTLVYFNHGILTPVARIGESAGTFTITNFTGYAAASDEGLVYFTARAGERKVLVQAADGLTPISWDWGFIQLPSRIDESGSLLFSTTGSVLFSGYGEFAIHRWDQRQKRLTAFTTRGAPALEGWLFDDWPAGHGVRAAPKTNARLETAFIARLVSSSDSYRVRNAAVFQDREGRNHPIVMEGDTLPGGLKVDYFHGLELTEQGTVFLLIYRKGDPAWAAPSVYRWNLARGIMPVLAVDPNNRNAQQLSSISELWATDGPRGPLVQGQQRAGSPFDWFRLADGKATPVLFRGRTMPGGGTLNHSNVSMPNASGQHLIHGTLADGSSAAFRLDADDTISLVLRREQPVSVATPSGSVLLGKVGGVWAIGSSTVINDRGQILLSAQLVEQQPARERSHVLILTPSSSP